MNAPRILVTGGSGYIGSHTVVELQQAGYEVFIIDNLSNSDIEVVSRIQQITGILPHFAKLDLRNKTELQTYFKSTGSFDGVIHFAASKSVGESVENPLFYYENNLGCLVNLLQVMQENKVTNLVFSSSCTVYGQAVQLPVTEETPLLPASSPYGNTKKIAEEIIRDSVNANKELFAVALRYFNPVGAHKSALIGELPNGIPNNLMPFITQTAIGKRKELKIYGNDYNTPDGTAIRDYIHVVDLANAHIAALHRMLQYQMTEKIEFYNIGTGRAYSVLQVINAFEKTTGQKLNSSFAPRRQGDIEQIWADCSCSNKVLNWKADKDIDEMALSAWKWELNLNNKNNLY